MGEDDFEKTNRPGRNRSIKAQLVTDDDDDDDDCFKFIIYFYEICQVQISTMRML